MQALETLAGWIKASDFTVILTGAGMSTESGLPDFRSKGGWWRNIDPSTVATVDALETNYPLFHDFYSMRLRALEACTPHEGHYILAEWEKRNLVHSIVTQNVDGFHKGAGSSRVYELHGSLRSIRCSGCGEPSTVGAFLEKAGCRSCGGKLRPGVVLFGEMLPKDAWGCAVRDIKEAELVLVIGTSLQVYPANQLPSMARGRTVLINYEACSGDIRFDLVLQGKARDTLIQLERLVSLDRG